MLFIQKKCNVRQRLFVTYLYVYVYNTISDDINSKFLTLECLVRVWEWHGIDMYCPVLYQNKMHDLLSFSDLCF